MGWKRIGGIATAAALALSAFLATPALADDGGSGSAPATSQEGPSVASTGGAVPLSCNIVAHSPYAASNYVWTGGTWSGGAAPVTIRLR